jgi:hypothetical protein
MWFYIYLKIKKLFYKQFFLLFSAVVEQQTLAPKFKGLIPAPAGTWRQHGKSNVSDLIIWYGLFLQWSAYTKQKVKLI